MSLEEFLSIMRALLEEYEEMEDGTWEDKDPEDWRDDFLDWVQTKI